MMKEQYLLLKAAFDGFLRGELSSEKLKPLAAPFGIYEQRNGLFMVRIRVTGGVLSCKALNGMGALLEREGGYAHLTSRQDIQFHDLPAERVASVVEACDQEGLPFKGGGGNTYRNIMVSPDNALMDHGAFDVHPYALAVHKALEACEQAFVLPRKLKIGFFVSTEERLQASVQDLGFLAVRREGGEEGFEVTMGGGMGRESAVGLRVFDFLPAQDVVRVAVAFTEFFHDHGDRTNRNQARVRFLLKKMGNEAFKEQFMFYYERVKFRLSPLVIPSQAGDLFYGGIPIAPVIGHPQEGFDAWKAIAVTPTRWGPECFAVRLFVPYGNLKAHQMRDIASLALACGQNQVRLLTTQDILFPRVHGSWLPALYDHLLQQLGEIDLTFQSFKGHVMTCVGASVCKIGMVDSPRVGDLIAEALDAFLPADTPSKQALVLRVADDLRISGCPNACSGHPAARYGVCCFHVKAAGEIIPVATLYSGAGVTMGMPHLGTVNNDERLTLPALVQRIIRELSE